MSFHVNLHAVLPTYTLNMLKIFKKYYLVTVKAKCGLCCQDSQLYAPDLLEAWKEIRKVKYMYFKHVQCTQHLPDLSWCWLLCQKWEFCFHIVTNCRCLSYCYCICILLLQLFMSFVEYLLSS